MRTFSRCDNHVIATIARAMQDDDEQALGLLSDALMTWPGDQRLWCLRGSIYASRGQRAEARVDLAQTLSLAPNFSIARFMLGLLELMEGRRQSATLVWAPLDALPAEDALRFFTQGLLALGEDRFDDARMTLTQGLAAEQTHPQLVPYINTVIVDLETRLAADDHANALKDTLPAQSHHLFMATYRGDTTRH